MFQLKSLHYSIQKTKFKITQYCDFTKFNTALKWTMERLTIQNTGTKFLQLMGYTLYGEL